MLLNYNSEYFAWADLLTLRALLPYPKMGRNFKTMNQLSKLFFVLLFGLFACQEEKIDQTERIVISAEAADFDEAKQVSPTLADGLKMDLWAPGPLLRNAVALTFDNNGVAFVAETNRRQSSKAWKIPGRCTWKN